MLRKAHRMLRPDGYCFLVVRCFPQLSEQTLTLSTAPCPLRVEFAVPHAVSPLRIDGIRRFCGSEESLETGR
jgi:hypothetical protein